MLKTVLGNIDIRVNSQSLEYSPIKMDNEGKNYIVDRRYKVIIDNNKNTESDTIIDCILSGNKGFDLISYSESGERLVLISFISDNIKLSIGVEGDIPGVRYEYMTDRLRVNISKDVSLKRITFFIAWLTMENIDEEEILTWFAADPTLES